MDTTRLPRNEPARAPEARTPVEDGRVPVTTEVPGGADEVRAMDRETFLARLREQADATAIDMLGERGRNCPYIDAWFARNGDRDAATLERMALRYAGLDHAPTAEALLEAIRLRLRMGIAYWQHGEDLAGEAELAGLPATAAALAPPCGCGTCDTCKGAANPEAVMSELGEGAPLDSSVRGRMERAFGRSFGDVAVHTGGAAHAVTAAHAAHALTVGPHIAFSPGAYRPGTVEGDLLIAHELAHTAQQDGARDEGSGTADALETEADRAAATAFLGGRIGGVITSTGLRLQRCVAAAPAAGAAAGAGAGILTTILGAAGLAGILMMESDTPRPEVEETPKDPCMPLLVQCLESPFAPVAPGFGRKDCGACYRECKHAGGVWPYYKCPL